MTEFGYESVSLSTVSTDCPAYECDTNPGDKCLPYCIDVAFCVSDELRSAGVELLDADHLKEIQIMEIDEIRDDLPECLGVKNQFMMDIHFGLVPIIS